jgi:membrane-bound serine protease (ClpP class)
MGPNRPLQPYMTAHRAVYRSPLRSPRVAVAAIFLLLGVVGFACAGGPGAAEGAVHVLTADGAVGPVMERYLDRGIDAAEDEDATAVVIRLDTPGGLITSMNGIVKRILSSEVPVIVYVSPQGGRAASAGTFITMASHVAAMAPATRIGAATPVGSGGEEIQGPLGEKVTNDAAAQIRALAELRGRNAEWAESAVRDAASVNASEALDLNVVDLVANDLDELLSEVDGREVTLDSGRSVTIQSAQAPVVFNDMTIIERFLDLIADPNIALLLISLGTLAIFIEIIHFGTIFPGVFGAISLILGFFALSVIPFNWAGVALIVLALILFGLEIFVPSGGILGVGGIVSLILGGLLLTSGNPPEFQVSRWLVIGLATGMGVMVLFVLVNILRIRRMPARVGMETAVGRTAVARSALDPAGFVFIDGEYWRAEAEEGPIQPGERVVVTEVHGLKLKVRKEQTEGG